MPAMTGVIGSLVLGYVIGAIPCGYLIVRFSHGKNILAIGDGRPGAANTFREIGPAWGILTGALDMAKGTLVAWLAHRLGRPVDACLLAAALGLAAGHNWSVFLQFRGGDGAGVTVGVYALLMPAMLMLMLGMYLLFLLFWYLRIRPFYLYHMYNWQTIFCLAPLPVFFREEIFLLPRWGLAPGTAFLLAVILAVTGLIKQLERYGFLFLFTPRDFDNKYARRIARRGLNGPEDPTP
ncbi:MAG: glycerol-3-phosphate acyltransferase [Planctomycetota bacterium]